MAETSGLRRWRIHPDRDRLLAEAHARPFTPLETPVLAARLAAVSGQDGAATDRAHMIKLCRRLGLSEPGPDSRWHALDAGAWRLRWERHTEFSTWTFFRPSSRQHPFAETAMDLAPADWLDALPGELLVATALELRNRDGAPSPAPLFGADAVGARLLGGSASVFTDFRPDGQGFTRYLALLGTKDAGFAGRLALSLLEIETYRMMALLAFPLAGLTATELARIEADASKLAIALGENHGLEEDRNLLGRLAELAGEAEALNARTSFRFAGAAAYHGIVGDRIAGLREEPVDGMPTLEDFMERRLAPAMRTCETVSARLRTDIDRIARIERMLNTRVEVAAEATSAALLASMDRRADQQLRLQRTVEGLSVAAVGYYVVGLLLYVFKAAEHVAPRFVDAVLAGGVLVPLVLVAAWLGLRRAKARIDGE